MRYIYLIILLFLLVQCNKPNYIDDYGKHLNINFPKNIEMIHFHSHSNFQDFTNFSIYDLSQSQTEIIQNQIEAKLCNSTNQTNCWEKFGKFYSLKISDSMIQSRYYLKTILTTQEINTLMIYEVKL